MNTHKHRFTTADYLNVMFDPGEYCNFAKDLRDTRILPVSFGLGDSFEFVAVNPIKAGTSRADRNVSTYRTFLIEQDTGTLEDQKNYVASKGMPFSAVVFSGNKSFHWTLSMSDAMTLDQYRFLAEWIHSALPEIDHANKNPSRLTRFPFGVRENGATQTLMWVGKRIEVAELTSWLYSTGVPEPSHRQSPVARQVNLVSGSALRGELRKSTLDCLAGMYAPNERNCALFKAAIDLCEQGYPLNEALQMLAVNFPFVPHGRDSFDWEEFETTVNNGYRAVVQKAITKVSLI